MVQSGAIVKFIKKKWSQIAIMLEKITIFAPRIAQADLE